MQNLRLSQIRLSGELRKISKGGDKMKKKKKKFVIRAIGSLRSGYKILYLSGADACTLVVSEKELAQRRPGDFFDIEEGE